MKKSLLLFALLVASVGAFSQTATFGIKAGVNFSKLTSSGDGLSISTQSLTSFHIGGVVDVSVNDNFSVQPGLLFSTKGGESSFSGEIDGQSFSSSSKITLNYLEVPINFLYKMPAGEGKVFVGAGPYLGYGLSAKSSVTGDNASDAGGDANFGSGPDDIKKFDFGLNFLAGYELKQGLTINFNYGLGLANLSNSTDNGSTKNQVIGISLGYFFK